MINSDMRFITRTSDGRGWQVSAIRNGNMKFSKRFSDSFHRGIGLALLEAKEYRNSIQDKIEKESKSIFAGTYPPFYNVAQTNSKTQVVGIYKDSYRNKSGVIHERWNSSWQSSTFTKEHKAFSISKYGDEGAFKLAFEARQKGISERMKQESIMVLVK